MIRPEYEDLMVLILSATKNGSLRGSASADDLRYIIKEINKFPVLRQIMKQMKDKGESPVNAIYYIYNNIDDISDARRSKWKNGEFIKVGRPAKAPEEKYRNVKKADRYKTIKSIKEAGRITLKELQSMNFGHLTQMTTKEAQRYAYYIQENIKSRLRALRKAGYGEMSAEYKLIKAGGLVKDIRTASLQQLKSFIKRGSTFLRRYTSTVSGVKRVRKKVSEAVYKATEGELDISKFEQDLDADKLFWKSIHAAVDASYGSMIDKQKYIIMGQVSDYFEGYKLKNADLQEFLDNYIQGQLEDQGLTFETTEDMRAYLKNKISNQIEYEDDFE